MKYNGLVYMISEGFKNIFKNIKSTSISLITMICAMFLFGVFFAIGENVNYVLEQVQKAQGMEVFLVKGISEKEISELEVKIKELDGINETKFKSETQALESFREQIKDKRLLEGYEIDNHPFSASFVITLSKLELNKEIENGIREISRQMQEKSGTETGIVTNITNSNDTIDTLIKITNGIRVTIGVIFVILIVVATTIISNTIRLTVYARRKEISIMKYVGATNSFIRWPFVVEGIIIGLMSALISILIVSTIYDFTIQGIETSKVLQMMSISLLQFKDLVNLICVVYISLGVGIGIVGSSISMKKYLEV